MSVIIKASASALRTHTDALSLEDTEQRLERNKRGCNKRGCKSNKMRKHTKLAGLARNLPDLREMCSKFAQICEIVCAKLAQICAKFTAPFVTVPFVPV